MMFTNESIFEVISGRRTVVRSRVRELYHPHCIVPTVKDGGGKIQVWRCMAASGVGSLEVVNGRLDASACITLICCNLEKDGKKLCGRDFIFQQDGLHVTEQIGPSSGLRWKGYQLAHWASLGGNKEVRDQTMQELGVIKGSYFCVMRQYWRKCNRELCFINTPALCSSNCCSWR